MAAGRTCVGHSLLDLIPGRQKEAFIVWIQESQERLAGSNDEAAEPFHELLILQPPSLSPFGMDIRASPVVDLQQKIGNALTAPDTVLRLRLLNLTWTGASRACKQPLRERRRARHRSSL